MMPESPSINLQTEPPIPSGLLPPLQVKELPEPPRAILKIIGPTAVITATALGSGELVMWPYLTAAYTLGLIWAAVMGMLTQYFINMEIERWALATGESVLAGLSRISRTIPPLFLVLTIVPYMWPGWTAGVGYLITNFFGWGSATTYAIAGLILVGLILTLGPIVYKTMERLQTGIIVFVVPGMALVIFLIAGSEDYIALGRGIMNVGHFPEGFNDWQLFAAALAFAGLGGSTNLTQSMYINDKGFGMGAHTPPLYSILTGRQETGYVGGITFPINKRMLERWRHWWKLAHREHFIIFFVIGCGTLLMLCLLAHITIAIPGHEITNDLSFLFVEGQELASRFGGWIFALFIMIGVFFLFSSAIGTIDSVGRIVSDLLFVNYTRSSRIWTRQAWYYAMVWVLIVLGIIIFSIGLNEPFWLLVMSASLNAVVMFIYNILILHMNRTRLPKELRPNLGRSLAMIWAILLFGFASIMMVIQWLF